MRKFLIVLMAVAMVTFLFGGCFPVKNQPPIITSDPVKTATVGVEYTYDVNATDSDIEDVLTYYLTAYPNGMNINSATGLIKWTPAIEGDYAVIVKVSDGELDITQSFTIVVAAADEPEPDPEPELVLVGITVDPKTMDLYVGEDDNITSVTACYEFRSYGVILDFDECLFLTSDSKVATVDGVGLVTAKGVGTADILVSYEGKTDTLVVTVSAVPAPKPMEIIADMPLFELYETARFTVEIVANSDVDKMVNVYFTLPDGWNLNSSRADYTIEYYDTEKERWVRLAMLAYLQGGLPDVIFGDLDSGYSLCDEKMTFRGNFKEVGTYTTVVEVWTVKEVGGVAVKVDPLCFKAISAKVVPFIPEPPTDG